MSLRFLLINILQKNVTQILVAMILIITGFKGRQITSGPLPNYTQIKLFIYYIYLLSTMMAKN